MCGDGDCESDGQCCDRDAVIGDRKQVQTEFHLICLGAQKPLPAIMKVILVISASCVCHLECWENHCKTVQNQMKCGS